MRLSLVRRLLLGPALFAGFVSYAQPEPIKFGKLDPKDLSQAPFALDSAEAMVLCDYGRSRLESSTSGLQIVFERVARIKILKKSGFRWASVEVPLMGSGEHLSSLRGFTYNLVNGEVVKEKLENDGRYSEDLTKHIRLRKFTMPNVREGSVIEFSYTIVSQYFTNLQPWQFQREIPVRWSEYRVSYPEYFDYKNLMQGYLPLAVREQSQSSTQVGPYTPYVANFRWAMKDVPAFVEEPFITTARDYVARLDFELASVHFPNRFPENYTWSRIDNALMESEEFGLQLDRGNFLKDELARLPATATLSARIAAIHALVRAAVKYNGEDGILTTTSLRKTYQELHRGNAADVNLLLIAALRAVHINANPVLLSTRDHGRLNEALPLAERLNYVVGHVRLDDGQDLFLDATEPLLPCGTLPERCLNQNGRLVLKNTSDSRWIDVKPSQRRVHFQQVQLSLTPQGTVSGKVHEEYAGYAAATLRAELVKTGEPKYRSEFAGKHSSWTVPAFTVSAREELSKPVLLDYEFEQSGDEHPAPVDKLYLSLLEEFSAAHNPFRYEARTYPVDFGMAQEETIMLTLNLPPGYELAEPPKPAMVELPDGGGRYLYTIHNSGAAVQLTSRLHLRKPVYTAEEYQHLREFYRLMLEKQAEKIIIQKKA